MDLPTLQITKQIPKEFSEVEKLNGSQKPKTWTEYLVTEEPQDVPILFQIGGVPVWTANNHSLIVGKKKSRKTLFLTWMVSQYYKEAIEKDILICDTEQGRKHVWMTRDRISRTTGKAISILSLRGLKTQERRNIIEQGITDGNFKVIIIDGIRDLLNNINDPDQCTEVVTWIEKMTATYGVHICNVLHLNKTSQDPRGHIGSELLNKAEITIELEKDEKANCTLVRCESSRDIPFETFAFTHDAAGLPEIVGLPVKGQALTEPERKERLQCIFDGSSLRRGELIDGIKDHFAVGTSNADKLLAGFERVGWIVRNGKLRSPATVYKLMIVGSKTGQQSNQ